MNNNKKNKVFNKNKKITKKQFNKKNNKKIK